MISVQLNRGSVSYEALGEQQLAEIATQIRHYVDGSTPSIEVRPGHNLFLLPSSCMESYLI